MRSTCIILEKASKSIAEQSLFVDLGRGYLSLKKYDLAEKAYLNAINMIPNRMLPRYLLAKLYLEKQDSLKAKALAKQIIAMPVNSYSQKTLKMINEMNELLK